MSANRRVAVTGLGVLSALGRDRKEFWQALAAGRSGIAPLEGVDRDRLRFGYGAQVRDFEPRDHFDKSGTDTLDLFAQYLVVAAREAVADAQVDWDDRLRSRTALITGTSAGGQPTQDRAYLELYGKNKTRLHPLTIPRVMSNSGASRLSIEFGVTGPAFTLSTACSSSNHAIGNAFWLVRSGIADLAITGGSDAPFCLGHLKAWEAVRAVDPDPCRPFSKDRCGMNIGEGAGALVLEPMDSAQARGARIYAEMTGFGMSSDAFHITKPSVDGASAAMRAALADGQMEADEVGYINAHGTGTAANDAMEVEALRKVFGDHADRLMVSSTKSMHGHSLGAAGAIEGVASVLALAQQIAPPTINFTEPDPECTLDFVPHEARSAEISGALSNSFAFGGLNAVLAFRRYEG